MEPVLHRVPIRWKRPSQGRPVFRETATGRTAIGDDHPHTDERGRPFTLARDVTGEATIAIDLADEATDISDRALHLNDQEGPSTGVPGDDVDGSTLAVDRERHLRLDDPLGQARQSPDERLDHPRMASVDKPVQIAAPPARYEADPGIHGAEYPAQHV